MTEQQTLKRTPLHEEHVRLGARLVPYAGFEMPVQYAGILKEHDAVRRRAGLFDLSHMGQFYLHGDAVAPWADTLTINAVETMKPLQARYNIFCNERGGAHDDTIFYRLDGRWLLVVNGANADKMWAHLNAHLPPSGVKPESRHGSAALIAIQGPQSVGILQAHVPDLDLDSMKYYFCAEARVDGVPAIIARTGYTGEDGFELFVDGESAPQIWSDLLSMHESEGLEPCGLGARDVLRLEAGMPLYGHELTEEITPVQAGQTWALKLNKPSFIGKEALAAQLERDNFSRIAGIVMSGKAPAREGYRVFCEGRDAGEIRSGSLGPSVDNKNIATALLAKEAATEGTRLEVEIRGTKHEATVVPLPFYKRQR
ncbi:MAG: glycine cleavage system aminomethyltransferase GcvT [Candidatus Eremiobacteraeota bacterium]|nr:glycine cleavage system aminomethyltransferase GcvT [Candidatus Eremiobacteraeota bacterium]MBV8433069.1 glycine cleavage system aminomethyltransferase GcvT [Candidatus Eremiobacteraeota bacterium]